MWGSSIPPRCCSRTSSHPAPDTHLSNGGGRSDQLLVWAVASPNYMDASGCVGGGVLSHSEWDFWGLPPDSKWGLPARPATAVWQREGWRAGAGLKACVGAPRIPSREQPPCGCRDLRVSGESPQDSGVRLAVPGSWECMHCARSYPAVIGARRGGDVHQCFGRAPHLGVGRRPQWDLGSACGPAQERQGQWSQASEVLGGLKTGYCPASNPDFLGPENVLLLFCR